MAHRVSPQAATDLDDIWYYVAKESGSIAVANHLIDSITDRFFLLAGHPYLGRSRDDDFGVGSRSFPINEYVIVYPRPSQLPWQCWFPGRSRMLRRPKSLALPSCVGRHLYLRPAPDYAESFWSGKAQAAAIAQSFGIFRNSA
jgi:plasmid stabilization system protein ParE